MALKITVVLSMLLVATFLPSPSYASKKPHNGKHNQPSSGTGVAYPSSIGVAGPGVSTSGGEINKFDPGTATADEKAAIAQVVPGVEPRSLIAAYLKKLDDGSPLWSRGQLNFVKNESVARVFPARLFYLLRFPQWPLPMNTPPPLGNNNIFVIAKGKPPILVTTKEGLENLFKHELTAVRVAGGARDAVRAWLALSQELRQDGMFRFSNIDSPITVKEQGNSLTATGKVAVDPTFGNSGEIVVSLTFAERALKEVQEIVNLKTGMRPICQSQKLLDLDPTVRAMAEQDLLLMGKAAGPYLIEQRAKSTPAIQHAIDQIWQRIEQEGQ